VACEKVETYLLKREISAEFVYSVTLERVKSRLSLPYLRERVYARTKYTFTYSIYKEKADLEHAVYI
jgi:hypothetical protein